MDPLRIETSDHQEIHLVCLHGELDVTGADRVRATIVASAATTVIVDLGGLSFMDSSGIAALAWGRRHLEDRGHILEVRGAHGEVRMILELCGMTAWLDGSSTAQSEPGRNDGNLARGDISAGEGESLSTI